jgi:hypothetical protein
LTAMCWSSSVIRGHFFIMGYSNERERERTGVCGNQLHSRADGASWGRSRSHLADRPSLLQRVVVTRRAKIVSRAGRSAAVDARSRERLIGQGRSYTNPNTMPGLWVLTIKLDPSYAREQAKRSCPDLLEAALGKLDACAKLSTGLYVPRLSYSGQACPSKPRTSIALSQMDTRLTCSLHDGSSSAALAQVPVPIPAPDELLIEVCSIALNPVDALYVVHPVARNMGRVVGSDVAGIVKFVGECIWSVECGLPRRY